jgi:SAM-dependent methyltransferase
MTTITRDREQAARAYDRLAPHYDTFTAGYAYEPWIEAIEERAVEFGLVGERALDLACGTGSSTAPLIARGYSVVGCDISAGMIAEARRKFPESADSFVIADMRSLPALGMFDLVLCLDDAINYLTSDRELELTFSGVAAMLAADGVFVFDVNSLLTYRTAFAQPMIKEGDNVFMAWQGEEGRGFDRGEVGTATVEIFSERPDGLWERKAMRHVQRHHEPEVICRALASAGLECVIAGQHPGAVLEDTFDEERHIKSVYFARHSGWVRAERR